MTKTFIKHNSFKYVLVAFFFILVFLSVGCAKTQGEDIFRFEVRQLTLTVGETQDLKIVYGSIEDEEICVESSDSEVLKVEKNTIDVGEKVKVSALKEGTVQLTVYVKDQENVTDTIIVTVEKEYLTYMEVSPEKDVLYMSETTQFSVKTIIPEDIDKAVTYTSSNPEVGTIDENGLFTALQVGETTVTATSVYDPTFKVAKTMTVIYNPTEEVTVEEEEVKLLIDDTYQIVAGVLPNSYPTVANPSLTYKSNKAATLKVDANGLVTALKEGTATVTVTSVDGVKKVINFTIEYAPRESVVIKFNEVEVQDGSTINLINGDEGNFTFTVTPEKARPVDAKVEYADEGVYEDIVSLERNNGIAGVGVGEAVITITYKDDNDEDVVVTINVVVTEPVVEGE